MNEQIKALARQAGGNPNYKAFRGHFLPPPPDCIDPATVDLEKFAELIVRECVDKIFDSPKGIGAERWKDDVLTELKQHFGVEE